MIVPVRLHTPRATLLEGDCGAVLSALRDNTIDAIVTDPPAGIGFMGKEWDGDKGGSLAWISWLKSVMAEALRVLKPGGHALVWALPRTSHWTATAVECAGFELRDVITHLFGTGFPKSLNLGDGLGSALKPAAEFWILARKPLDGTLTANVERWGTGGLRIDDCRIPTHRKPVKNSGRKGEAGATVYGESGRYDSEPHEAGRWPANLTLEHSPYCCDGGACYRDCPIWLLDQQSGFSKSPGKTGRGVSRDGAAYRIGDGSVKTVAVPSDAGGASRFFYVAKPARSERDAGCEALPVRTAGEATDRTDGSAGLNSPRAGAGRTGGARNHHPTVKSISLMRYLCRLVTPRGGCVLDPFAGSGSTGVAALAEALSFVGVEREPDYLAIAEARIRNALAAQEVTQSQPLSNLAA